MEILFKSPKTMTEVIETKHNYYIITTKAISKFFQYHTKNAIYPSKVNNFINFFVFDYNLMNLMNQADWDTIHYQTNDLYGLEEYNPERRSSVFCTVEYSKSDPSTLLINQLVENLQDAENMLSPDTKMDIDFRPADDLLRQEDLMLPSTHALIFSQGEPYLVTQLSSKESEESTTQQLEFKIKIRAKKLNDKDFERVSSHLHSSIDYFRSFLHKSSLINALINYPDLLTRQKYNYIKPTFETEISSFKSKLESKREFERLTEISDDKTDETPKSRRFKI